MRPFPSWLSLPTSVQSEVAKPCGLCAVLRRSAATRCRCPQPGTGHGLRIALVNDDQELRLACREMVLAQRDGWELHIYDPCALACGAPAQCDPSPQEHEAPQRCPSIPPDVVLLGLPEHDGSHLACMRKLKALAPDLPVLIVSGDCDAGSIAQCCAAGADGYLLKPLAPEELARAVGSVAQGWPVLCREAQKAILNLLHRAATATTAWFPGLTGREHELVGCLVASQCDKEISTRLGMAEATVHVHLVRLYRKLGVHSRQQAVARLLSVGGGAKSNPF